MVGREGKRKNKGNLCPTQHNTPHPSLHPSQGCAEPCLVVEGRYARSALCPELARIGSDMIRQVPAGGTKSLQQEAHLRNSLRAKGRANSTTQNSTLAHFSHLSLTLPYHILHFTSPFNPVSPPPAVLCPTAGVVVTPTTIITTSDQSDYSTPTGRQA